MRDQKFAELNVFYEFRRIFSTILLCFCSLFRTFATVKPNS